MHKSKSGFTLVELLIVIVVIAILAAISVVAYNGIQDRAEMAKIVSTVNQYKKKLQILAVYNNGRLPMAHWSCLGTKEDYPAEDGYLEGWCYKPVSDTTPATGSYQPVNPALNQRLIDEFGDVPSGRIAESPGRSGRTFRGMFYDSNSTFTGNKGTITYIIEGERDCPIGEKVEWSSSQNHTRCHALFSAQEE